MEKPKLNFENPYIQEQRQRRFNYMESKEFLDAKIPLEYKYTFPSGEKLEVFQSKRGGGFITIKKEGGVIFDFSKLLLGGWKFVTPTYFKKHPKESALFDYSFGDSWGSDSGRKLILLGEFHSPQELLSLLHEIGHSVIDDLDEIIKEREMDDEIYKAEFAGDVVQRTILSEELAKLESKRERNAWAYALRALRDVQKKTSVNLRSLFPTFDSLKKYIKENLATYREKHEWIIKEGYDEEFYKELQKMFDKWQYE